MTIKPYVFLVICALCACDAESVDRTVPQQSPTPSIDEIFFDLNVGVAREIEAAFEAIEKHWQDAYIPFALDSLYLLRDQVVADRLITLLSDKTGQQFGDDVFAWWQWLWQADELRHPRYGDFKSRLYGLIDPPFRNYFGAQRVTDIRLDEVVWGGVRQDGIPPLRYPKMIRAAEATYLADSDIVFGIAIGDDVRAYPKRILAWHEMFVDEVGGKSVAGVY